MKLPSAFSQISTVKQLVVLRVYLPGEVGNGVNYLDIRYCKPRKKKKKKGRFRLPGYFEKNKQQQQQKNNT